MCNHFVITSPDEQPHAVLGVGVGVGGGGAGYGCGGGRGGLFLRGWMLFMLCMKLIMAEMRQSPHNHAASNNMLT